MDSAHAPQAWHGFLMGLAAWAVFNVGDVFVKKLVTTYSVIEILFLSVSISMPLIYLFVRWYKGPETMRCTSPRMLMLRGVLIFMYSVAGYYGIQKLSLPSFYTFVFATPIFSTLIAVIWLKERVTRVQTGLLILAFVGVVVAFHPSPKYLNIAALVVLFDALVSGLAQNFARKLAPRNGLGASIVIPYMVVAILAFAFCLPDFRWPTRIHWLMFAAQGALSGIGNSLLVMAFYKAPASQVTPTHYSQMIWGTLYGYLFFREVPDVWIITGAVIIIGAGMGIARLEYLQSYRRRHAPVI